MNFLTDQQFIDAVLSCAPRVAAFDCDGTLWAIDAGEGFLDWELQQGLLPDAIARWVRARYADYKAGKVEEEVMCGEMVTIHTGMSNTELEQASEEYFAAHVDSQIFPVMRDLVAQLRAQSCDIWAVSSTNQWVIEASAPRFGIARDHVLAAAVTIANGSATDHLVRVPSGDGKPKAIRDNIGPRVDVAFGNSRWDAEMLEMAQYPFVINPTEELLRVAEQRKWPVYIPGVTAKRVRSAVPEGT
jgi:phosphoserine phosphatase